jgi:hypothetical protein
LNLREISFEEGVRFFKWLCEASGVPVPRFSLVDDKSYVEGEYAFFKVCLKKKTNYSVVFHEWLHYVFDLVCIENDRNVSEENSFEHRIIDFLASTHFLASVLEHYLRSERLLSQRNRRNRGKRGG